MFKKILINKLVVILLSIGLLVTNIVLAENQNIVAPNIDASGDETIVTPNIDVSKNCKKFFKKDSKQYIFQNRTIRRARRCKVSISPYFMSSCITNPLKSCISFDLQHVILQRNRNKKGFSNTFRKEKDLEFNNIYENKTLAFRLKPKDKNAFNLIYAILMTDEDKLPEKKITDCSNIKSQIVSEFKSINSCKVDGDCGQFLKGTSCGCSNNLVARKNANPENFYNLFNLGLDNSCDFSDYVSTCECREDFKFICFQSQCKITDK